MAEIDPLAFQKGFQSSQNAFDSARQNRLQDLAFARQEQAYQQEQNANRLFSAAVGPDGTIDRRKLITGFAQGGLGSKIPAVQAQFAAQDKTQIETRKAQVEAGLKQFEAMGQLFSGVKDQASYDAARQQAAGIIGPDAAAKIPSVYDPQQIAQGQAQAMSVKDRLAQELQRLQFSETQRHNAAGEGLTAQGQQVTMRGQDITQRGQDMTDARARDTLAQNAANKTPTEYQGKSASYGARAEEASRLIGELGSSVSPLAVNAKQAVGRVPLIGGALEAGANAVLSPQNQKLEQAQRDFINAVLRQESGAAISQSEFENAKRQYFPQPNDSPEVIAQKAANRELAIEGFRRSAGKFMFSAPQSGAAASGAPAKIADKAGYDALPSGALFIAPDGTTRRKP